VVWWDRLFGTFRAAPRRPEATMPVGVPEFRDPDAQRFSALLLQPFATTAARPNAEVSHAR
jgi:sterol desaturase/sphingolipid hydroxylase (fatty acid hydroxylase superfamily)